MNKERRKQIDAIISQIEKARNLIEDIRDGIDQVKGDEEEYRDNMPESLQSGEKYERADTAVQNLDEAYEAFDIDFDDIIGKLNEAQE